MHTRCTVILLNVVVMWTQRSPSDCMSNQFYDSITMECATCPDVNSSPINTTTCACKAGYELSQVDIIGSQFPNLCSKCTTNCTCPNANSASLKYDLSGAVVESLTCVQCAGNAYASITKDACIACPHFAMTYSPTTMSCVCTLASYVQAGLTCVSRVDVAGLPSAVIPSVADVNAASRIQFETQVCSQCITQVVFSALLNQQYLKSAVGCSLYLDMVSCQSLANQCVLQGYSGASIACQLFNRTTQAQVLVAQDAGQVVNVPWLYYERPPANVYYDDQLLMTVSFSAPTDPSVVSVLSYYLAVYTVQGQYVDFRLLTSELILCPHSNDDASHSKTFGVNMLIGCTLNLQSYVDQYTTYMYELFLQDTDLAFKPVPVLITNYLINGHHPNQGTDITQYQFTRRFFIVDNIASVEGVLADEGNIPSILRYPTNIVFNLQLHKNSDEKIYMPYVQLTYAEKTLTLGKLDVPQAYISFQVFHNYQPDYFWMVVQILFIIFNVFIIIVWLMRVYVWSKANPRRSLGKNYFTQLIVAVVKLALDSWADAQFYFLFFVTGYWFVFYKFQSKIYILIPNENNYRTNYLPFDALFYTMFIMRMLNVALLIYKQSSINLYFVDWEKTQIYRPKELDEEADSFKRAADTLKSKVSVWRTLLVANEFNELQTVRTISVEWTIFIFGFFMVGLDWKDLASEQPSLSTGYAFVPNNYVLQYFISQVVYLVIGVSQLIIKRCFQIWFPLHVEDFVDLCSVANISIFILDGGLHGYYIHGQNPFGFSEGSSEHLQECLKSESMEKGRKRGLIQKGDERDESLCTFELYMPTNFKDKFEKAFNKIQNIKEASAIKSLGMEQTEIQKTALGTFLKDRIYQLKSSMSTNIKNKEPMQRFFNFPPDDIDSDRFRSNNLPYFYKDYDHLFKQIFFCGYEYYLLVTEILIFNFWLLVVGNYVAAILLLYTSIELLSYVKNSMSETNLSNKTKIDPRFLI